MSRIAIYLVATVMLHILKEKLCVDTIVSRAKVCGPRGMRYETEWLLECLLFRIKSPSGYEHVRNRGLMPLPSFSTLRRLLHGMRCSFGFNKTAIDAIKMELSGCDESQRQVVLCYDEMSIQSSVTFNEETYAWDGFVCLNEDPAYLSTSQKRKVGEDSEEYQNEEDLRAAVLGDLKNSLADHALVFMCRPLLSNWVQPFGVFAAKSQAPADAIYRLMISAITLLDGVGADVVVVVSDGATNNKGAWKLAGIGVEKDNGQEKVNSAIDHPTRLDNQLHRRVHFMCDPPHLLKCIRNHLWNHQTVQVNVARSTSIICSLK